MLKGKLKFAGNIRENAIHKERFYTSHQVYDHNHLLNQVIACALNIVEGFSSGNYLYDRCKRALFGFPETSGVRFTKKQLDGIVLTSQVKQEVESLGGTIVTSEKLINDES